MIKTASAESWTAAWERADSEYRAATATGARLTTVLDDDFPLNLRLIDNTRSKRRWRLRLSLDEPSTRSMGIQSACLVDHNPWKAN